MLLRGGDQSCHGVVTNRAKFDACTSSSFREVKTDRHTDKIVLYNTDLIYINTVGLACTSLAVEISKEFVY